MEIAAERIRRIASRTAMELEHWLENCVCANRTADAAGRAWNAARVNQDYRPSAPGEQYFAFSFSESGLARFEKNMGQLQSGKR